MSHSSARLHHKPLQLGAYQIKQRLAKGGMAEIFLASRTDTSTSQDNIFALKCILPHLSKEEEFITMFLDEAQLTTRLHHPNIVKVHGIDYANGVYFIIMDYVPSQNLRSFCTRLHTHPVFSGAIPYTLLAQITSEAASALEYAHNATDEEGQPLNIIHRDTSPSNLLISYDGEVKLIDFGVAKANTQVHQTRVGVLKGRLSHMAPEHLVGQEVDQRADIFSLGTVLYELTTNRGLFQRETEGEIITALVSEPIPPPSQWVHDYPIALERVVMKALEREPDERYQSAAALRKDLLHFISSTLTPQEIELPALMHTLFSQEMQNASKVHTEPLQPSELSTFLRNTDLHKLQHHPRSTSSYTDPKGTPHPSNTPSSYTHSYNNSPKPSNISWLWPSLGLLVVLIGLSLGLYLYQQKRPVTAKESILQSVQKRQWMEAFEKTHLYAQHAKQDEKQWLKETRRRISIGMKVDLAETLYKQGHLKKSLRVLNQLTQTHQQATVFRLSVRARYLHNILSQISSPTKR